MLSGQIGTVEILGVQVHNMSMDEALDLMDSFIASRRGAHLICTPNADHIVQCQADDDFRRIVNTAHLVVPDGMAIVYASRWLGTPLKGNVGGRLLFVKFCERAASKGYRVFLLGAAPGVADAAAAVLATRFPGLQIAGTYSPPFSGVFDQAENSRILDMINSSSADALFVALGTPKQEKWLWHHLAELKVGVCVGVGYAFDVVSSRFKEPPIWMTRVGLEWFYRLLREPKRLWRRYLVNGARFATLVLAARLRGRFGETLWDRRDL